MWRDAKSLDVLLTQVNALYPGRDKSNDGTIGDTAHQQEHSDHNPNSHGVVCARDITHDPASGCDSYKLAEQFCAAKDRRVQYVISNRKIANADIHDWAWRPYNGSNPHDHHVHVSVRQNPALYDLETAWNLGALTPPPATPIASIPKRFTNIVATVFGGIHDRNLSAYDGHVITDFEVGFSLPARVPKGTRLRAFANDKLVVGWVVDVGPWNTNDPYWLTGARPQAESGTDMRGRHTNKAGIDLTPAAAKALGIDGKGVVDWEFA